MRIGLRTIKTAISATLAIIIANFFNLLYPTSAGIIAVLSVTNTKKTSLFTGLNRMLSLAIATTIAFICFTVLGFTSIAFGFYLLLFIPLAVYLKLSDGIVVSSVLVTQYLIEKNMSLAIIRNEFALMIVGVGLALLINAYMPDTEKKLKEDQNIIELMFRTILTKMALYLNQHTKEKDLFDSCNELQSFIATSEIWAKNYAENQLTSSNNYYQTYFVMRRMQSDVLDEMIALLEKITVEKEQVQTIQKLFEYTAETFSENNDAKKIVNKISLVYSYYREKELPQTRKEFENRAHLFQLLQLFESFIKLKTLFMEEQKEKNN